MTTFTLIHSPLVGPLTWTLIADKLRKMGHNALAPALPAPQDVTPPYWNAHAFAVARALRHLPDEEPVVLVGHSGAGMLLPAIRQVLDRPVAVYIFVDACIAQDGKSRLDLFDPQEAGRFRARAKDGLIPAWTEQDLARAIPDHDLRRRFAQELEPLPLAVYEEPLPVFLGWPDAPCAYLQFSPLYDSPAQDARTRGWSYRNLQDGHFHMLTEPEVVARALIELARVGEFQVPASSALMEPETSG